METILHHQRINKSWYNATGARDEYLRRRIEQAVVRTWRR
jgi:hypothetical protein